MKRLAVAAAVQREVKRQRLKNIRVGLVPTMGALHEGHLSLIRRARQECDYLICSIFVNPAQFDRRRDLSQYPRTLKRDLKMLRAEECDLVFTPRANAMYPEDFQTYVLPGTLASDLEGAHRPGHFRGVATACLKLFTICKPHVAYFGQKDYQQALIVRQMAQDFNLGLRLTICATVRGPDGLALSSRNRHLSARQRETALAICRTLAAEARALKAGQRNPRSAQRHGRGSLQDTRGLRLDYFAVRRGDTLTPPRASDTDLVCLAAARVGPTRLIDNVRVSLKSAR